VNIKILGMGCRNCQSLHQAVIDALAELDLAAEVEKVEDLAAISQFGPVATPALVVDDEVVSSGRVPRPAEVKRLIQERA